MGALSKFLRNVAGGGLSFWCEGCREAHTVWIQGHEPNDGRPRWSWNGDVERPVFGPSVLVTGHWYTAKGAADEQAWQDAGCPEPRPKFETADTRCHTFVGCNGAQPGEITFLSDCTHALAGQVRPLAEMPAMRSRDADDASTS
jgi:hypothetical protein